MLSIWKRAIQIYRLRRETFALAPANGLCPECLTSRIRFEPLSLVESIPTAGTGGDIYHYLAERASPVAVTCTILVRNAMSGEGGPRSECNERRGWVSSQQHISPPRVA